MGNLESKGFDNEAKLSFKSYNIASSVAERVSTVDIKCRLQNDHQHTVKTTLFFYVPEEAFISSCSLAIDGSEYVGRVVSKNDACHKSPGTGLDIVVSFEETIKEKAINIFKVDITLEAEKEGIISLTYYEILQRRLGLYTQKIFVFPGQIADALNVSAIVLENQGFEKFSYKIPNSEISVPFQFDPTVNSIRFEPSRLQQSRVSSKGINGPLVIEYDLKHEKDAGNVVVEGYYFVHYFTPAELPIMDKNIIFVIDASGSMLGTKIKQARESMLTILDNLNSNDYFNIIIFSSSINTWLSRPAKADSRNISEAKTFVDNNLKDGGGTNINDALLKAIKSLKSSSTDVTRAQIIFFLTDGNPTEGITDKKQIRQNVKDENKGFAAIYCLGFGFDLDHDFLKNLASENNGFSRPIHEDKDATEELVEFYNEIKDPVLLNVDISYDKKYVELNSTTNNKFHQYFNGTEVVVAGKLNTAGIFPPEAIVVHGISKDGNLNLQLKSGSVNIRQVDENSNNKKQLGLKKIKELMDKYSTHNASESERARQEAINLAIENNFITKFTSFVLEPKAP